jgi:Domain of unknown function (DUF2760)
MSFFERLKLAFSILFGGAPTPALLPPTEGTTLDARDSSAASASSLRQKSESAPPVPVGEPHASALFLLALLQREGRLLDFLREDVGGFSDADIGAAARLVHDSCQKVLQQYLPLQPVATQAEGAPISIATDFDAQKFRLVGHVSGPGPWRGTVKHRGLIAATNSFPPVPTSLNLNVLAPCEVEVTAS